MRPITCDFFQNVTRPIQGCTCEIFINERLAWKLYLTTYCPFHVKYLPVSFILFLLIPTLSKDMVSRYFQILASVYWYLQFFRRYFGIHSKLPYAPLPKPLRKSKVMEPDIRKLSSCRRKYRFVSCNGITFCSRASF